MTRDEAEVLLGLEEPYDALGVRSAFARSIKDAHPDTRAGATRGAVTNIVNLLQQARDVLLSPPANVFACQMCDGRGKVRAKWGQHDCVSCKGTGERQ